MDSHLENIIKNNKDLPKNLVILKEVIKDGNCFYRLLSIYFTESQNHHQIFREIIYESAKTNKDKFISFFSDDETQTDQILVNMKYDNYLEEIKNDGFYAGNLELALASIIFKLNICIYTPTEEIEKEYKHFTNIWFDINDPNYEIILILFSNNNHYSLLSYNNSEKLNNEKNDINTIKILANSKINFKIENFTKNKNFISNNNKLCGIKNNIDYYDNIFNYLLSYKINIINGKTNWRKVFYPKELKDNNIKKNLLDKRRQNFRITCSNYLLKDNNSLYYKKNLLLILIILMWLKIKKL